VAIELPVGWVIVLNVAGWPLIQFSLAWIFTRIPAAWFRVREGYRWERDGRIYERVLAIRRWKDRLPEAGSWFGLGFAKNRLESSDEAYLRRFEVETLRGEICHWVALAWAPVFFLWNPWWADVVMVVYALVANVPCILTQRYNRARFRRVLSRRT